MSAGSGQVEIENVSKRFDAVTAVNSVTLTIPSGKFFSLLGPSGCGKTTLLRLLSGFEYADSGTIRIADAVMNDVPPNRRPTALVFQRWALFPHLSVLENVCYGLRVRKVKSKAAAARADELLQLVGLTGLSRRKPAQLSGGQQQRVALARALAIEPKVLLLDEPLSSLDLKLRAQMQLELKRLQRELGMTFVYVTHDQGEAMTMSDTVAVMNQGSMIQAGAPLDIYDHPTDAFVASFIGDTNLFDLGDVAAHTGSVQTTGMVSLRYERVQVGGQLGTDVRLAAHVREVIFAGSTIRYLVDVDGTEVQLYADIAHQGESRLFAMGAAVEVGWQADAPVPVGGVAP